MALRYGTNSVTWVAGNGRSAAATKRQVDLGEKRGLDLSKCSREEAGKALTSSENSQRVQLVRESLAKRGVVIGVQVIFEAEAEPLHPHNGWTGMVKNTMLFQGQVAVDWKEQGVSTSPTSPRTLVSHRSVRAVPK